MGNFEDADLTAADARHAIFDRALFLNANLPRADLRAVSLVEADLSRADFRLAVLSNADLSRAVAASTSFDNAGLQHCKLHGADFRGASLSDCKIGSADFKACRIIDVELQRAIGVAQVAWRISDPHYCSHCGKCREVWGTRDLADSHHKAKHPDLPNGSVPISIEDGCRYIRVAVAVGQAAWCKGLD